MRRGVQLARLVAVIDQNHEPAPQPPRGIPDPFDGGKIDLRAPAGFQRYTEAIEIILQGRS